MSEFRRRFMSNLKKDGYTNCLFIKSAPYDKINTGYVMLQTDVIEFQFLIMSSIGDNTIFGSYSRDSLDARKFGVEYINDNVFMVYNGGDLKYEFNTNRLEKISMKITSKEIFVNSIRVFILPQVSDFPTTDIIINGTLIENGFRTGFDIKFFNFKIKNLLGKLIRDFIPVKRNSDNVYGFYDKIEKKFYQPTSKSFTGQ